MAGWNAQRNVGLSFTAPNTPNYEHTLVSVTGNLGTVNGTCYEASTGQGPYSHNGSPITVTVSLNGVSSSAVVSTVCNTTENTSTGDRYPTSSGSSVTFNFGNITVDSGVTISGNATWGSGILACSSGGSLGLSPVWSSRPKLVPVTRTVTLNANGGTFKDGTKSKSASNTAMLNPGSSGPVTVNFSGLGTPTWSDHKFLGWYTSASGGGLASSPVTLYSDVTYYAHWSTKLNFNMNGGDYEFPEYWIKLGDSIKLPTSIPIRSGFDFHSWYDDITRQSYAPGDTFTFEKPTTLRARWVRRQCDVYVYNNLVTQPAEHHQVLFGDTIELFPGVSEDKTRFVGWDTDEHVTGICKSQNINYLWDITDFFRRINGSWDSGFNRSANFVRYIYDNNIHTEFVEHGHDCLNPNIVPTKDECEFLGWSLSPESTTVESTLVMESKPLILYAVWKYDDEILTEQSYQVYALPARSSSAVGQTILVADGTTIEKISITVSAECENIEGATSGSNYIYLLRTSQVYNYEPIVLSEGKQIEMIRGCRGSASGMTEDSTARGYQGQLVTLEFEIPKDEKGYITLAGGPDLVVDKISISFVCTGRKVTG